MTHRTKSIIWAFAGVGIIGVGFLSQVYGLIVFGAVVFIVSLLAASVKHDPVKYQPQPARKEKEKTLSELIEDCQDIFTAWNTVPNVHWFNFFELATVINTVGDNSQIGQVHQWRATWSKGVSLDFIQEQYEYNGDTPEEAVTELLNVLKSIQREDEELWGPHDQEPNDAK